MTQLRVAPSEPLRRPVGPGRSAALRFVVFLGVVSLFADMTYEGGRSIAGPFLAHLGASATVVGIVAGFGELVGYGLRLGAGYLSDRTQRYWPITIAGYVVNLLAVPALALAGRWEIAALLIILERAGRAIRNPARDAMLAHATHEMGRGWGFGLHEAMDQTGALIGPLLVALALHRTGNAYRPAFALLLLPAILSVGVLLAARRQYPRPSELEMAVPDLVSHGLPRVFWVYVASGALLAAGYADFALLAYHFATSAVVPAPAIPILYAFGMGMAAVSALAFGRLLDRVGLRALMAGVVASGAFAPLVFLGNAPLAVIGMAMWGIGMGVQDSTLHAALAGMVPPARRAGAYGVFDAVYGVCWFLGSALMGLLYDRSIGAVVALSLALQLAAIPLLGAVARRMRAAL
jgi:MFS family permease